MKVNQKRMKIIQLRAYAWNDILLFKYGSKVGPENQVSYLQQVTVFDYLNVCITGVVIT